VGTVKFAHMAQGSWAVMLPSVQPVRGPRLVLPRARQRGSGGHRRSGAGDLGRGRVQFDADAGALQALGDEAGGACPEERIEHDAAEWAAGLYARLRQFGRERGEVRLGEGLSPHCPNVALVTRFPLDPGESDKVGVRSVFLACTAGAGVCVFMRLVARRTGAGRYLQKPRGRYVDDWELIEFPGLASKRKKGSVLVL
jgi:hypothetical protein